jgi:hypothetical protein
MMRAFSNVKLNRRNTLVYTGGNIPWYLSVGATPIAAYQAKGATSYAASKVNLANPGTYDISDGAAFPTWASATGWTFVAASLQYLVTGLTPSAKTWSALIQYSGVGAADTALFGADGDALFSIYPHYSDNKIYYQNGSFIDGVGGLNDGNLGFAGNQGYKNGLADGLAIPAGAGVTWYPMLIGCTTVNGTGAPTAYINAIIKAFIVYSITLNAAQMLTLATAMEAL